jgi:hypothetical protein
VRMAEFSDDGGVTQPGAYGRRWRGYAVGNDTSQYAWGDQLDWAVARLRADPGDRRVVIQMWDAGEDPLAADRGGKDVPCNLSILPWVSGGALHLTINNRSNDVLWGLFGSNCVVFSVLLEYLAGRLGLPVGRMYTWSNNFHAYLDKVPSQLDHTARLAGGGYLGNPYRDGEVQPYPLFSDWGIEFDPPKNIHPINDAWRERTMQEDLLIFFEHGAAAAATAARWPWLRRVAVPLALAHQHWKHGRGPDRYAGALSILRQCAATDWRRAAEEWITRRRDRAALGKAQQTTLEDEA